MSSDERAGENQPAVDPPSDGPMEVPPPPALSPAGEPSVNPDLKEEKNPEIEKKPQEGEEKEDDNVQMPVLDEESKDTTGGTATGNQEGSPPGSDRMARSRTKSSLHDSEFHCDPDVMGEMEKHEWFHDCVPLEDVNLMLVNNGDFLIRKMEMNNKTTRPGLCVRHGGVVMNFPLCSLKGNKIYFYTLDAVKYLPSIMQIIDYHYKQKVPVHEDCIPLNPIPRQAWELTKDRVRIEKKIGEGAFGEVFKGYLRTGQTEVPVAIKLMKTGSNDPKLIEDMNREARLMRQYSHMNIVRLHGCLFSETGLLIVMEMVEGGGLDKYLKKKPNVSVQILTSYCYDVAAGLAYLHSKNCMHRDVAARNCLVTEGFKVVKLSDFGLSVHGTCHRVNTAERVAIRWLAPEVLYYGNYYRASDVWSYGMLCWEVFNEGKIPFGDMDIKVVREKLYSIRPSMDKIPPHIRNIMKGTWQNDPKLRVSMEVIESRLLNYRIHAALPKGAQGVIVQDAVQKNLKIAKKRKGAPPKASARSRMSAKQVSGKTSRASRIHRSESSHGQRRANRRKESRKCRRTNSKAKTKDENKKKNKRRS